MRKKEPQSPASLSLILTTKTSATPKCVEIQCLWKQDSIQVGDLVLFLSIPHVGSWLQTQTSKTILRLANSLQGC